MCFQIFKNKKKPAFLGYKKGFSKSLKIMIFPTGLTDGFGLKLSILGNIGQENVFYDILKRKNAFVGYKN